MQIGYDQARLSKEVCKLLKNYPVSDIIKEFVRLSNTKSILEGVILGISTKTSGVAHRIEVMNWLVKELENILKRYNIATSPKNYNSLGLPK